MKNRARRDWWKYGVGGVLGLIAGVFVERGRLESRPSAGAASEGDRAEPVWVSDASLTSGARKPGGFSGGGKSTEGGESNAGTGEFLEIPVSLIGLLASHRIAVPDDDLFTPNDPLVAALAIDDRQKARLQTAYREGVESLKRREAEAAEIEHQPDGSVLLSVPEIDASREQERNGFAAAVRRLLGEERGKVFLAAKQGDAMFGAAGTAKDYLIEMESVGDGNWRYRISELEGDSRRVMVGDSIPQRLRHLTEKAKIVAELESLEEE